jgi:predicted kinase
MTTNVLVIVRGLPGSGKSTWAKAWVRENPDDRARLSRDDIRAVMFNGEGILSWPQEEMVSEIQRASAMALLIKGKSVVIDDMNLRERYVKEWIRFARQYGATTEEVRIDTPLEECILRDRERGLKGGRTLGEKILRDIAAKFRFPIKPIDPDTVEDKKTPGFEVVPYVLADPYLPDAYIFDVDGTLAHNTGGRGFFDWSRVGEDAPDENVIHLARSLDPTNEIIVVSGRSDECREETSTWLRQHGVNFDELHMRAAGDHRPDSVVKSEIFDAHIRERFNVRGVVDDRPSVARLWWQLGLTLLKVGDPDQEDF